jgi:hypothetical protein
MINRMIKPAATTPPIQLGAPVGSQAAASLVGSTG